MTAGSDAAQWYGNEIAVWATIIALFGVFANTAIAFYAVTQSRAAKLAASAAKQSADALLNAERAWLIVTLEPMEKDSFLARLREGESAIRQLKLAIKNVGKTPARIQTVTARSLLIEYGAAARGEWTSGQSENWFGRLLVPADSTPHFVVSETEYEIRSLVQTRQAGELTFVVLGQIEYSDVHGRSHSTGFRIRRELKWSDGLDSITIRDGFAEPEFNVAT